MYAAAISGETFASPTIDAVLMAIVQVTGYDLSLSLYIYIYREGERLCV